MGTAEEIRALDCPCGTGGWDGARFAGICYQAATSRSVGPPVTGGAIREGRCGDVLAVLVGRCWCADWKRTRGWPWASPSRIRPGQCRSQRSRRRLWNSAVVPAPSCAIARLRQPVGASNRRRLGKGRSVRWIKSEIRQTYGPSMGSPYRWRRRPGRSHLALSSPAARGRRAPTSSRMLSFGQR